MPRRAAPSDAPSVARHERSVNGARVVHTVPMLFGASGTIGGAERYALELARHMADVVPTTLLTFGDRASVEQIGRLHVKVLARTWRVRGHVHNPLALKYVPELLRADVIHCHQPRLVMSSLAALLARVTGKRVFASDLGGGGWDVSAYVSTDRWYHGHLHISEYSRRVSGHGGKPWAEVIYGGVDSAKFHPVPRAIRKGRAALFVGRLMPHKGVGYLVQAATREVPVTLIGQPYDDVFLRELRELATGRPVTFRHDFRDTELVDAYQQALCVVLPSVYRAADGSETHVPELLGQTLLEGMACGIPAICTDVASMPEIVEDGVGGFVVPPNDAAAIRDKLAWLDAHPEQAARMGEAARRRVLEKFGWADVVERCLAAYARAAR
jgi:glycosyltransferase involved in cell wall biosynthesis